MELLTEKYRPKIREDLVGNKTQIDQIFSMVNIGKLTHIIVEGNAGTGKTSTALVVARTIFGSSYSQNFLELNASDSRRIDDVRGRIKTFAKTLPVGASFKIILLDEGDEMTPEAQNALRRTMEKYSSICIFFFAVNNVEKLIEPIRSRCQVFHFGPISIDEMENRLHHIYHVETNTTESVQHPCEIGKVCRRIAELSQGDLRKAINHLQMLLASGEPLSEASVDAIKPIDYGKAILDSLQKGRFMEARAKLYEALELGFSPRSILTNLQKTYIGDDSIEFDMKANAIFELAECDYRFTLGVDKILAFDKLLMKLVKQ